MQNSQLIARLAPAVREFARTLANEPSPEYVLAFRFAAEAARKLIDDGPWVPANSLSGCESVSRQAADAFARTLFPNGNKIARQKAFEIALGAANRFNSGCFTGRTAASTVTPRMPPESLDELSRTFRDPRYFRALFDARNKVILPLIIGGLPVRIPEAAQLITEDRRSSAVLIAERTVLTAAHSVRGKEEFSVWFEDAPSSIPASNPRSMTPNGPGDRDLALLELEQKPKDAHNKSIQPASIASQSHAPVSVGDVIYAAGFGRTGSNLPGEMNALPLIVCSLCNEADAARFECVQGKDLVAGISSVEERGICWGDSGGPVFIVQNPDPEPDTPWTGLLDEGPRTLVAINRKLPAGRACGEGSSFSRIDDDVIEWLKKEVPGNSLSIRA